MMNHLRFSYYTGNAAVAIALNPLESYRLVEVRAHLSAAGGAANMTLTLDANQGAVYDLVIATLDMTAVTDYVFQPDAPMSFENGDQLLLAWANANNRVYGITLLWEAI